MRIVIDLQGAQSESRFRGVGRYSLALALGVARNAGPHEIWLLLNGALPAAIPSLRQAFAGLVPPERIRVFEAAAPLAALDPALAPHARCSELLREYVLEQLRPDMVLVTSLFEGYVDDSVISVGRFGNGERSAVVLYDLIPLMNPDNYLQQQQQKDYYYRKIDSLKRAGLLLSISDYSRLEALDALHLEAGRVVSISTAIDDMFRPGTLSAERRAALRARYGLTRGMLMYAPGGFDARKNIDGLITAFSLLPAAVRSAHQLLIASKIGEHDRAQLEAHARRCGLRDDELVLTGYVSDELLIELFRCAELFIFPSKHEGFGLPVLEAMACGALVIGADNTSIPEVIGCAEALFDAGSPQAIADKMAEVLGDPDMQQRLREHGAQQAARFSWDATAQRALRAMEVHAAALDAASGALVASAAAAAASATATAASATATSAQDAAAMQAATASAALPNASATGLAAARKPRLAFVSPLPPERTGIADYAAQLLPALTEHFDIELVLAQTQVSLPPELAGVPQRTVDWFARNGAGYDQILYQFGNSPYHSHMFALLAQHPGVVVLHDFFLSSLLAYEQMTGAMPGAWSDALFASHGYPALQAGLSQRDAEGAEQVKHTYPCNLAVLQGATRVIVHSDHARTLAQAWYGAQAAANWSVAPLPRAPGFGQKDEIERAAARSAARAALGIGEQAYLVCTFGFIAPTKLTHELVQAWIASTLHADAQCELVLVGANHGGDYGVELSAMLRDTPRIRIAGWTDEAVYHQYLQAADAAVQLRAVSRGETSAAVLDCMNYGLPTIVNANGSMAALPDDTVLKLPDSVTPALLTDALETLRGDAALREAVGGRARHLLQTEHSPEHCAALYAQALALAGREDRHNRHALLRALSAEPGLAGDAALQRQLADALARAPDALAPRQLLVDVTNIARNDLRTGIERVVRTELLELLKLGHTELGGLQGLRVEPVYLVQENGRWLCRYARRYTCALLGLDPAQAPQLAHDAVADLAAGDIYYGADFAPGEVTAAAAAGLFAAWRARGVSVNFVLYDLLPVLRPDFFPSYADLGHGNWLEAIAAEADRLVCISGAVADEMAAWLARPERHAAAGQGQQSSALPALKLAPLHLGADIAPPAMHETAVEPYPLLAQFEARPSFLMVGTIEPRKGHLQAIAAFEELWRDGVQANLVIVGNEGWRPLPPAERRTIPLIVQRLEHHPELGKRLFWLRGVGDAHLEQIYQACDCLLAPSEGEGFGLPLIEAALHRLPVLARDLPVFREVAGRHAHYFDGLAPHALAEAVQAWLALHADGKAPSTEGMAWSTWQDHVRQLLRVLDGHGDERLSPR